MNSVQKDELKIKILNGKKGMNDYELNIVKEAKITIECWKALYLEQKDICKEYKKIIEELEAK